jgi:hypothetical protein
MAKVIHIIIIGSLFQYNSLPSVKGEASSIHDLDYSQYCKVGFSSTYKGITPQVLILDAVKVKETIL